MGTSIAMLGEDVVVTDPEREICLPNPEFKRVNQYLRQLRVRPLRKNAEETCYRTGDLMNRLTNRVDRLIDISIEETTNMIIRRVLFFTTVFLFAFGITGYIIYGVENIAATWYYGFLCVCLTMLFSFSFNVRRVPLPVGLVMWVLGMVYFEQLHEKLTDTVGIDQTLFTVVVMWAVFGLSLLAQIRLLVKDLTMAYLRQLKTIKQLRI